MLRWLRLRDYIMPRLRVIDTIRRSFTLLKKDPTLVVLFVVPAIFQIGGTITSYLRILIVFGPAENTPPMLSIILSLLHLIVGFFFRAWAAAGAVLKITELEKGSKLGLREALSGGLKKAPRLLVPLIVAFAITTLISAGLNTVINGYPFMGIGTIVLHAGPSGIALRLAMGFLFVIALYIAIRLRLYAPACVLENNFGLKTSWGLVKGNWWRLFAIILIFFVMSAIIGLIPIAGTFLGGLIVGPLVIVAVTLAYLQLRETRFSAE
jgi:hypothetical protein